MSESENTPDRIQKKIVLRAPQSRVWKAVSDAQQFGTWFGVAFADPFVAGKAIRGTIQPTKVDESVAKLQEPHRGHPFDWTVENMQPESLISFRWHPFAIDKNHDYSTEPTTLVVFELSPVEGGTLLTITESGFSKIPLARRAQAFKANEGGWEHQTKLLQKYLEVYVA